MADDLDVLTRTLWGECRGEPEEGKIAVAWVIKTRAARPAWWGRNGIASVCRAPYQFSCWLPKEHGGEFEAIQELKAGDTEYQALSDLAQLVISGAVPDPTNGATHYKRTGTPAPWDHACAGLTPVIIGKQSFYKLGPTA